jgi:serine/threonine protein kinase
MAEVFLGRTVGDSGFSKLVAIKRVLPNMAGEESVIQMLVDEARIAANLSHINIAQIFDLGRSGDGYFIAMEYIHGVSLTRVIGWHAKRGTPLPPPLIAYVSVNVCAGLNYAHTKEDQQGQPLRIIHRDVSPDNVMVSFEGEVKLIDFGIVKADQRIQKTQAGTIKGKVGYMSPEQARGRSVDLRTDIFSTGMMLYEMLALRNPFLEDIHSEAEAFERMMIGRISPPSAFVPDCPRELEQICMTAVAMKPEDRFSDAGEMERALEAFRRAHPYSRQQMAAWMKESFKRELERLRRFTSGRWEGTEISPSKPAEEAKVIVETILDESPPLTPAGGLAMAETALDEDLAPPSQPYADVAGAIHAAPTKTLPRRVDTEARTMADVAVTTRVEAQAPTRIEVPRAPGPPGTARVSRSRRRVVVLTTAGALLIGVAVGLFLVIQNPGTLERGERAGAAQDAAVLLSPVRTTQVDDPVPSEGEVLDGAASATRVEEEVASDGGPDVEPIGSPVREVRRIRIKRVRHKKKKRAGSGQKRRRKKGGAPPLPFDNL